MTQFKNVQSFGVHNSLQPVGSLVARSKKKKATEAVDVDVVESGDLAVEEEKVSVSTMVVGCRKRVATMSWSGGKPLGGIRVRPPSYSPSHADSRRDCFFLVRTSYSLIPLVSSSFRRQPRRPLPIFTSRQPTFTSSVYLHGRRHRQYP